MIWGGETTVQLNSERAQSAAHATNPSDVPRVEPPKGGRCQELALAAARVFAEAGDAGRQITLLAAGTDGRDGPTDAAGAFADASVWNAIRDSGRAPELALAQHDSYVALDAVGALHRRGLTGTNVMDVVIGVIE
jgi:hydroxypyruvate reductase